MDKNIIKNYVECLIKGLKLVINSGLSIICEICPYPKGTAIVLRFPPGEGSIITTHEQQSLSELFKYTQIDKVLSIPEDFANIMFQGTNIFLINDIIVFIKDEDPNVWSAEAAGLDIKRLIKSRENGTRS